MASKAKQINEKGISEGRNGGISFVGKLDSGELLTGTPVVTDCAAPSPAVLTFTSVAVNTAEIILNGEAVPIGMAVQFHVTGGVVGGKYIIKAAISTDSTPSQPLVGSAELRVTADC